MPYFDWPNENIKSSCKLQIMYGDFLENLANYCLEQIVKNPTRDNNVLDLCLTNQPDKVHSTKTLHSIGSSDHSTKFQCPLGVQCN